MRRRLPVGAGLVDAEQGNHPPPGGGMIGLNPGIWTENAAGSRQPANG